MILRKLGSFVTLKSQINQAIICFEFTTVYKLKLLLVIIFIEKTTMLEAASVHDSDVSLYTEQNCSIL